MSRVRDSVLYRPQARSRDLIDNVSLTVADIVDYANAVTPLRALAGDFRDGDFRELRLNNPYFEYVATDMSAIEQAIEELAARVENTPQP
jgi:hypothetical protein